MRKRNKSIIKRTFLHAAAASTLLLLSENVSRIHAGEVGVTPLLEGIGFYEMIAQTSVNGASLAGGTEIVIYGQGMSHTPASLSAIFTNKDLGSGQGGPPRPQDIAFNSHTDGGKLKYSSSAIWDIHNVPRENFDSFDWLTYEVSLMDYDSMTQQVKTLKCGNPFPASNCFYTFSRAFTPLLYTVTPPVVYSDSEISFWIDPKSAQDKRSPTLPEFPFVEVRLDGYGVDFEGFIEETTVLPTYTKVNVRGKMGAIAANPSSDVMFRFRVGYALHMEAQMTRCSYDNSTCYKAKAVAKIDSIDSTSGYTTGGQVLTVKGYGFQSENIVAKVDGVNCTVLEKTDLYFKCLTGANAAPSTGSKFVGQHGLKRRFYNSTFELTTANITSSTEFTDMLAVDLEAPYNVKDGYSGNVFSGYFKAPATAGYRFYTACDDWCQIKFSSVNMDPTANTTIYTIDAVAGYRGYLTLNGLKMTQWLNLTKDSYYYMEVKHIQRFGADHISVAVEIEDPTITPGHHQTMREVQRLMITQNLTRDTTNVTITNPDGGEFTLTHIDPKTSTAYVSGKLNTNMSAWEFNQAVAGFYSSVHNAWITVTRAMYDVNGTVTNSVLQSVTTVYSIQVQRSLTIPSANTITVQRVSSKSQVVLSLPRDTQLSSLPMTGTFKIRCALDKDGTLTNDTLPINQTTFWAGNIKDRIIQACPVYRDKIEVWTGPQFSYNEDGRDTIIRFVGLNYDVPQLQIIEDLTTLEGTNIVFNSSTWIPYNPARLFYEPVPFEFLYTVETTPQVIVSVSGVEAVCASLNCGYTYVAPAALITGFTYAGTTLTITGTSLPTTVNSIMFSNINCLNIVATSGTQITCDVTAVAGSWAPIVTDVNGIIPVDASATNIIVNIAVASVSPNTSLNPYGGTILTIVGSGFPQSLTEGNKITLTFSDSSVCQVISIASTQIRCLTSKYSTGTTTATLTVNVNGKINSATSVGVTTAPTKVTLLTPNSVSPVLKTLLTINITGFPNTINKDDLEVSVVSTNLNPQIVRQINVVEAGVYGTGHYIKAKFGGSDSGIYQLKVRSRTYGNFDTTGITLQTIGKVTDFNPKSGSVHGGTLITVNGYHFSDDYQDNPIRIGYTDCMVEYSSPTQLKCRTEPRVQEVVASEDFIVLLKTYEEAVCGFGVGMCTYTWTDTAYVSDYSVAFDTAQNQYVLTVTGTGFGATTANTEVLIDNLKQEMISASNTQLKVRIVNMMTSTSLNTDIHLPVGHPGGTDTLNYATGINLTPRIHGISPSVGSLGGALIVADVRGFGNMTTAVQLVTSSGVEICATVTIVKYGEVQCMTKENVAFALGSISLKVAGVVYACQGASANSCDYQSSDTLLTVSALASSANTIELTGTGFSSYSTWTSNFLLASILANSVVINSDTSATATFNNGIPLSNGASGVKGKFYFQSSSSPQQQWALFGATATISNLVTATAIDSNVVCSFAGGCQLSISQPGLLTSMKGDPAKNNIRVCGQLCNLNTVDSTGSVAKCTVPALASTYSIDNFKIISEQYLVGTPFSSNSALTMTLWDGSLQNGWTTTAKNCYFGTAFRAGYVGELNEVKYFMNRFTKKNFVGKLKFQGSADALTWTDIFTVGQEIHEGWNYQNYPPGQELKFRYYRFFGTETGSCLVGELSLRGYEVIDSSTPTHTCSVALTIQGTQTAIPITGTVTYQDTLTPLLNSISPRFGSVVGNELVTFTGVGFSSNIADYTVKIDGIKCNMTVADSTQFSCLTNKRPGLQPNPSLEIQIAGKGTVATQGLIYRYVNRWSEPLTWGGEFAPLDGDMVYIPDGLSLLVDVDSTPILSAVVVEGALIFPPDANPNHLRTFDAHYVMIRGGLMEVGTEQFPYSSKLLITMHSNRSSPELPIFGNKVIAMYDGVLDLHGVPRTPTWTSLDVTAEIGATQITIIRDVDWQVNEEIVIAPTGYFNFEAETRTIIAVDRTNPNKPILTLDSPLQFQHFSAIQHFGTDDWIEMRAEVGLLTRNVMYRGDPETSAANEYGAQIMVHSNGMETLTARIEYVHFFNVGQAFQLGRYPIHFHLIGAVHNSYIKGNTIQQSFNRACTIHGVSYLRVTQNVAYNVKGHNFFIEDAAETKNLIENNLAIWSKKSWSLLNSDQSPASFWITNPDNIFRGNHAAGSDNYGFWFDTKPNPTGPSFDPNICPENTPLGEFANNVAHSNGRYGLRIFHKLKPRTYPCLDLIYDKTNLTDPYWQNPSIPAVFQNFTSFKNRRNGAIALDIGHVRFENFKVSDNILAGIEVELSDTMVDGYAMVDGALVIGRSDNADDLTNVAPSHGIIGPRTENFQVHNVKFYNFDIAGKAALGSCSHCFAAPSTDSGGRMVTFSGLTFDSSVTIKIRYQEPWREIFYDLDGSLTGIGAKTWATSYWRHNLHPECSVDMDVFDGLICNSSVQVRRVVFYKYTPDSLNMMEMKILQIDDRITKVMNATQKTDYYNDINSYSVLPWRPKANPLKSWAMPLVTGKKYKIHWQKGVDFMKMQIDLSPHWKPTDGDVYIVHNFTDVRAQIDFLTGGDNIKNESLLPTNNALKQTGANIIYNDTATRQIHYIINGKNQSRTSINLVCYRCVGSCLPAINNVAVEDNIRYWSNPKSWTSGKVPLADEDVVVEPGWNMIYDLVESPIYRYIQVNGRVTFKEDAPKLHLRAKYLFVRMGELIIGTQNSSFAGEATITLFGMKQDEHIVYENAIEAGNKILANTALISMYGMKRSIRSRLLKTVMPGDTTIYVETGLDWKINDTVALPSTTINWFQLDTATVLSYDSESGIATLDRKLSYYHWGAAVSTASKYNGVDMRGEVMLLTRNIKIKGNDTDAWGCQIVTSDFVEGNLEQRIGRTYMDHVEIYNCSQYDTWKAAIRFDGAVLGSSRISNSAIHHGLGIAGNIDLSENIELVNNNFYTFSRFGVVVKTSNNVTIDGNWVAGIHNRGLVVKSGGDTQGAIVACGYFPGDKCKDISVTNNIVSSLAQSNVDSAGYSAPAHDCGNYQNSIFRDNIAHSINGYGAIIYRNKDVDSQRNCIEASRFIAYKCVNIGIVSNQLVDNIVFSNMTLIDNGYSASANIGVEGDKQSASLRNILFYGETEARDCLIQNICVDSWDRGCLEKNAIMPSSYANHNKPPLIDSPPMAPHFKMKGDASFGGTTVYNNLQFINFKSGTTYCGMDQRLIRLNRFNADYLPATKFVGSRFENVAQEAMAYLFTPPNEWAVLDDCGQFPCTGPLNTLLKFEQSTFAGAITPLRVQSNFQIIASNDENSGNFPTCKKVVEWNGYYCNNEDFAMITFESLDEDKLTRIITPIQILGMNLTTRNVLNTFMDHMWDGFYTSMKRLSRWPSIIQAGNGMMYQIVYTGTPPLRQKFQLKTDALPVILRIKYPKAGVYIIKDANGKEIVANPWDNNIQQPMQIRGYRGGFCGENRYVGVVNILEFYMNKDCTIFIEPIDSIQASVRMNWTMAGFFADGGTTKFVDRVAASLGIKPANIKIVAVYQGSVVVDFTIVEDKAKTVSKAGGMDIVQTSLTKSLTTKSINLGAPILNAQVQVNKMASTAPAAQTYSSSTTQTISNGQTTVAKDNSPSLVQAIINANKVITAQTVYNTTTVSVVKTQTETAGSGSNSTMVAVIGSIIALIILGAVAGAVIYRRYQQRLVEVNAQKMKSVDQSSKIDDDSSKPDCASGVQDEKYEEQYHPRMANLDIFGNGDIIKKVNEADQVNVDNVDSDEEDEQSSNADNWSGPAQQPTQADLHTQSNLVNANQRNESPLGSHISNLNQQSPEMLTIKRANARATDEYQSTPSQAYNSSHKIVDGHLGVPK